MRKSYSSVSCQQFHLKFVRPKSCFERINVEQKSNKTHHQLHGDGVHAKICRSQQQSTPRPENDPHGLCACNSPSHDCVCLESSETIDRKTSQQILVSSALRRPHASYYSQLDSQILPEPAKTSRAYRAKSASTVYSYAKRPVSASETSSHLGRQTKASLLRSKSAEEMLHSKSAGNERHPRESVRKKKPCVVRQEYMLHQNLLTPKEVFDYMKSVHAYLTGARYNRSRLLDSKSFSKLGIYIPKDNLNTYIMKKPEVNLNSEENDVTKAALKVIASKTNQADVVAVATNTDPHYLSLNKWHNAEWNHVHTKKQIPPNKRDCRKPVCTNRIKPIKTQYINYNNVK